MSRSSRKQIEADEIKILNELQINCKNSLDKISQRCGFSRQKTWRLLKKLESSNIIWGYTAVTDELQKGLKRYYIIINLQHLPINDEAEKNIVNRTLDKIAEGLDVIIEDSVWVHGSFDWILSFYAPDIQKAKKFNEEINKLYKYNIDKTQLLETVVTIKKNGFINPTIKEKKKLIDL
ncbi:MAG: Lrp/AsnC family transcriptional regulator [Candidatus Thermoplasmatota archaeon]